MDIAVVTGASSGLGLVISRRLLSLGFRVYGLGGNYNDFPLQNVEFRPVPCDLADAGLVEHKAREILAKENAVAVLVNNAKLYPADSMIDGAGGEFARSLNINLLCPLILIRTFLPGLKRVRGKVVTINAATPETSRGGPAGAASAGGLRWMTEVLFHEFRDHGVTFSSVSPEPNRWRPSDAPRPKNESPQSVIDPQAVADAIETIVQQSRGNVVTEIVLRPERLIESTVPSMREVPYPKPQPIPYTVPREVIEAEEQLDREAEDRDRATAESESGEEGEDPRKRRRRRRRRGETTDFDEPPPFARSTARDERDGAAEVEEPSEEIRDERPVRPVSADTRSPATTPENETETGSASRRRRRGRKPRPASREERPGRSPLPRPGPLEMDWNRGNGGKAEVVADRHRAEAREGKRPERENDSRTYPSAERTLSRPTPSPDLTPSPAPRPDPVPEPAASESSPAKKTARKTVRKAAKKAVTKTAKKAAAKKTTKKAVARKVARKTVEDSVSPEAP
jgi:NAD(P)-dependent dehydrogenase (short-subunit alcohol dehydrogenase family)